MFEDWPLLEIERCICSRLWYTASIILSTESYDLANCSHDHIEHLKHLITTILIASKNEKLYEWISHKMILRLDKYNLAKTKEKLYMIQFYSSLKYIHDVVPKKTEEELLKLFEGFSLEKPENTDYTNRVLSKFLENSLYVSPALTCWIMNHLSDSIFQDACKSAVIVLLKKESINKNSSLLLCILSKANIIEYNIPMTEFYPCIYENCNHNDVELAFYSRKNTEYLKEWHTFLDSANYRLTEQVDSKNLDHFKKICNLIFYIDVNDSNKSQLHAKQVVLRVINSDVHWLYDILKISSILLNNEEYSKTCILLYCPLLKNLWPTLFLHFLHNLPYTKITSKGESWQENFSLCKSLLLLSNNCCDKQYTDGDPILVNLSTSLNSRVEVVKWILNFRRNVAGTARTIALDQDDVSVKHILERLWDHCTLGVIKKYIDIHECDSNEITSLLQQDDKEAVGVFRAYRALQIALKAILASEAGDKSTPRYFAELESSLNALTLLSLRLELIENVYAMMFLRHDVHFNRDAETDLEDDGHDSNSAAEKVQSQHGFVCSVPTVKRLLALTRRCLVRLGIDFAKLRRELSTGSDEPFPQDRLFWMDSCLTDASWRLELLTSHGYVKVKEDEDDEATAIVANYADALLTGEGLGFSSRLKSQSIFYNEPSVSSDDEEEEEEETKSISEEMEMSSFEASSTNDNACGRRDKRRSSKSYTPPTPVVAEGTWPPRFANSKLVVNYMLAPKESLLLQCLWKADYARARQVIEMFDMQNTFWAANFAISKEMENFRNEAAKQSSLSYSADSFASSKELQIFERIRLAAQGGYQNSRLVGHLETFLASQESNARLVVADSSSAALDVLALCALDLGLTVAARQSSTSGILDVAAKYARSSRQLEASRHARHLEHVQRLVEGAKLDSSVPSLLCDATVPLTIQDWRETTDFWQSLLEKAKLFRASQSQSAADDDDDVEADSNSAVPPAASTNLLVDIDKLCRSNQAYLPRIVAHLNILRSIVPDDERNALRTESSLLGHSLNFYFGRQIFDFNVEPESLETVASKLGVCLAHNILVNCCPKLTCYDSLQPVGSETWGCIVLNEISRSNVSLEQKFQDPNQCVADILLELLQAIKRLYPNCTRILNKDSNELSKDSEIQKVLSKTSLLASVDLSELSDGEQTVAFFLNLWNLMFLHTLLTVWVTEPPLNPLRHFISSSSVNYHVGDLGRISLATLKSKLVGGSMLDPEFISITEDLNEVVWQDLDLVHDPRVIFAMANEFYDTPAIRIYYPQTLNRDLDERLREYIGCFTKKEFETMPLENNSKQGNQIIRLPKIVEIYEKRMESNTTNLEFSDVINQQLGRISDYFSKSDKIIIKYEPAVRSYDILVKYEKSDVDSMTVESFTKRRSNFSCHLSAWSSRSTANTNILHYLEGHCWLLSHLVKLLHKEDTFQTESGCDNLPKTACFDNISSSPCTLTLASALFHDNTVLLALSENLSLNDLWIYFEKCLKDNRIQDCLDVTNALPCKLLAKSTEIQCLKDKLLCQMINEVEKVSNNDKLLHFIHQIKDVNVLAQTIFANIKKWPVNLCEDALFHALHHKDKDKLPSHCRFKMNETLCRLTVFRKMLPTRKNDDSNATWQDVLNYTEQTDPVCIVQSLVETDKFELCLDWLEYQSFALEITKKMVTEDLLIGLLKSNEADLKNARKLLTALPKRQSLILCEGVLKRCETIRAMKFTIEYLLENCESQEAATLYHKTRMGVEILDQLEPEDQRHYIPLIREPLLMLEQLLMNRKLKILLVIINAIQKSGMIEKAGISIESFDEIVRFYAGKSLDFRVSLQRDGIDSKVVKDGGSALGGTSSSSLDSEQINIGEFTMPVNVPFKEEWIPNDKAKECDCCKAVIFSMFNRRHHCRRCGRVVCAACSQQRMQVLGYPVPVRVCDDCKRQTVLQTLQATTTFGTSSAASSDVLDCWRLTIDEAHNKSVREEFSFDHAPNVSMCLAIMSLHSDHKAYPSFLLDHCHEMKKLLQPGPGGRVNPEIDHALIIKMIRSLLIAVKMKCAKLGFNAGLAHCDRFLSQVDLIATLVQSDCLTLIPTDDSLDEHALRKLRDLLTEKEQWQLALDVSTKAGLDTHGVWAAWGKAYLKAGHLDRARTKFSHCLEKVSYEYFDDWIMLSYPDTESKTSEDLLDKEKQEKSEDSKLENSVDRKRQTIKSRPAKNSPLLVEILEILDNHSQSWTQLKANVSQDILTTLNSLKAISQGQFSLVHNWNSRNVYYDESLYYLVTYGSLASILEFHIKYEEYKKCLDFVLENNVDPEIFFSAVYIRCLNTGNVEKLVNAMRAEDPSLFAFKKLLIYACISLDKKHFFHSLYHLQLLMGDHTRAAMSCVRFYTQDARDYADLCFRSYLLVDAQKHLETELSSVENLSKRRRRSISSSLHSGPRDSLTMEMEPSEIDKHINTISRQLEVVKFLSRAEKEGRLVGLYLQHLSNMDTENAHCNQLPTLFGNQEQKTQLAVLAILCGRDTEEGFGIAFRIMQDYNLRPQKVYSLAITVITMERKIEWKRIEQLIKCMTSSGAPDSQSIADCVLSHCVKQLLHKPQAEVNSEFKDGVDCLIRLINDVELKIDSYIESKQLKNAYLLVLSSYKQQRDQEKFIRKISKEADKLGQNAIRMICTKWLTQNSS